VIVLGLRTPLGAFVAALLLASLTGAAYVLLLWAAYQAGRAIVTRSSTAVAAGAALGSLAVQLAARSTASHAVSSLVVTYLVFVALPLLAGRYIAQHKRLVATLDQHNRQLRAEGELLAEQERLRERLRIAREMHDSLGRRLSLVSVQAAALEVSPLPPREEQTVRQLAAAARAAMTELHELVGALRDQDETYGCRPGVAGIDAMVEEFQQAGVAVTLRRHGDPVPLSAATGQAAYRVVEEGLSNATKHAPGRPVTVSVQWESDALLLTIVNSVPDRPDTAGGMRAGHGLRGLSERVRPVGGILDHGRSGDRFRLFAMLPATPPAVPEESADAADDDAVLAAGGVRTVAVGLAAAVLMFVALPASMLLGVTA
jgi:signal transduction histidine kinase